MIETKQQLLDEMKATLKKEFVGIDTVIDSVVDSLSTWFLFPELQERPQVINLWGMTGVGKTALVLRIAELLDFKKKLFRYDMGTGSREKSTLKEMLSALFRNNNGQPYMLMMDEFQYAKTKNEKDSEIDNPYSRILWDLLDSGKFQNNTNAEPDIAKLITIKGLLEQCLAAGVKVADGKVVDNITVFKEIISQDNCCGDLDFQDPLESHTSTEDDTTSYHFFGKLFIEDLYKLLPTKNLSIRDFKNILCKMDGPESIALVEKVIEHAKSNEWIDCTRAVIFILGNLDDAYRMSSSFNPDINADDFHELSKQISISHIKAALKKGFRNEHIARLGNNHIIYPAFSRDAFKKLIDLELNKTALTYFEKFGVQFTFSESFREMIYQEGVYPSQGTRPLFSTIYQMVNTKVPALLSENILKSAAATTILFDVAVPNVCYHFYRGDEQIFQLEMPLQLKLEKLRAPERDDQQAITAVHEAGHAVVSMAASRVLPEYICSTSSDADTSGFVILKSKWNYFSKEDGIRKIAEFLGGIIAEKIIFGEDKITRGAEQDIERATELATKMIKDYGMGSALASIDQHGFGTRYSYLDKKNESNAEVRLLLDKGKLLAEEILLREKPLLLQLADHLSDERIITKEAIAEKAQLYGSQQLQAPAFIEDGKLLYYRNHLKNQVQDLSRHVSTPVTVSSSHISLNRGH